jgi:hypothetical protein
MKREDKPADGCGASVKIAASSRQHCLYVDLENETKIIA